MRAVILALGVVWAAAGAALAGPSQFDLVCTGNTTNVETNAATPWSDRIAIDLTASAYCEQDCKTPIAIELVQPGLIMFVGSLVHADEPNGAVTGRAFYVNRTTGEVFRNLDGALTTGSCSPATFTPFPKNQF